MMTTSTCSSLESKLATYSLLGIQKTPCLTAETVSCFLQVLGYSSLTNSRQTLRALLARSETVASGLTAVINWSPLLVTILILIFLPGLCISKDSSSDSICCFYYQYQSPMRTSLSWIIATFLLISLSTCIDYNADVSRRMRTYSLIAHCSQKQINDWSCKLCSQTEQLKDVHYIENRPASIMAYAGFMSSIDKIVFTFRGTINATNWVEDFTYIQVPYKKCSNCKVHEGFYLSYMTIAGQVHNAVAALKQKYPGKELVMTGASLGGALATIAAIQTQTQGQKVSELHTYGSPRVGNADFAMYVRTRVPNSLRVVHNRDIVPHVPLLSQNYHHIPYEILYDEAMHSFKICDQSGQDESCSNSYYPNYVIQDHTSYWIQLNVSQICAEGQIM